MNPERAIHATPLKLLPGFWYFALPCGLMAIGAYGLTPLLYDAGYSAFISYVMGAGVPLTGLLLLALVAYLRMPDENRPSFRQRYRLFAITKRDWRWLLLILALKSVIAIPFAGLAQWALNAANITLPAAAEIAIIANEELVSERGGLLVLALLLLFINVLGEELWFRGYILPRQEAQHGNRAWIVHWLLWWFVFHFFKWWDLITIFPVTGLTVYLAHRTRNTTVMMVEHYLNNLMSILILLLVIR